MEDTPLAEPFCTICKGKCEYPPQMWFTAEHELQEAVRAFAEEDGRSISNYLSTVVRREVKRRTQPKKVKPDNILH